MNILLMGQHYEPEEVSGAVLATELSSDLVKRGHQVSYVTCQPNYPLGKIFPGYRNFLISREHMQGVKVIRTWSYISLSKGLWSRILNFGTFSASAFWGALAAGKPDLIFSYSPPLPLGILAWVLSRLWNVPWILRVEDLFPEAAVASGVLKNQNVIKFFSKLEIFLYRKASHISVISDGFKKNIINKGIDSRKISVAPVWADSDFVKPLQKENDFRKKYGLKGKFIILYSGNLGLNSSLEDVLKAAIYLKDEKDIEFVLVGEGVMKEKLQKFTVDSEIINVKFLPFQPRAEFPKMLAAADLSLVTLNQNSFYTSLPSKTFNIMASGRPILAVTPLESEISQLVKNTGCGVNVKPDCPDLLAQTIIGLKNDPESLVRMGVLGRKELESTYSRNKCVQMYESLLMGCTR